jgi:hypothetical protein
MAKKAHCADCKKDPMLHVKEAKARFDELREINEARGQEVLLGVVGYASGRDPFRLMGRVSFDTGFESLPVPELTMQEMQSVAYAAKMALYKVLSARLKKARAQ